MFRPTLVQVACLLSFIAPALAQNAAATSTAPPATGPTSQPVFHLSQLIIKDIPPIPHFLQASTTATTATIAEATNRTFYPLMEAAKTRNIPLEGPATFIFHSITSDPNEPFQMDVGFAVTPDTQPFGEFQVVSLEAFHCATFYYTGPAAGMHLAYPQAFAQLSAAGLAPSGVIREVALYWEDEPSPNNVVEIQIGLAHAEKGD